MNSKKAQKVWRKLFGWGIGDKCKVLFGYHKNRRVYLYGVIIRVTLINKNAFVEITSKERPERSGLICNMKDLMEDSR